MGRLGGQAGRRQLPRDVKRAIGGPQISNPCPTAFARARATQNSLVFLGSINLAGGGKRDLKFLAFGAFVLIVLGAMLLYSMNQP